MGELLWISFLSGMATPLGGLLVFQFRRISYRLLALFLGLAAGIMVTVVITELMPASIQAGGQGAFLTGSAAGWLFMLVLRRIMISAMDGSGRLATNSALLRLGWFMALAIALHDVPEGLAIGAGDAVNERIGFVIALAIALHNIPEGISIAVPLRMAGVRRGKILWVTFLAGFATPLGTLISLGLLSVSKVYIALSLAFAGGAMAYVVSRDILPEALTANKRAAGLGIAVGALLMMAVSEFHS